MKKHACAVCERRFRSADALGQHATDKHGAPALLIEKSKPEPVVPNCIECGTLATLVGGKRIYPHRPDLYHKSFYLCDCGAYCGCHPNTTTALGYPCGAETRRARSAAHEVFDPIWRRGSMGRADAYRWLARHLNIDPADCHIGMMTADQARQVVAIVKERVRAFA